MIRTYLASFKCYDPPMVWIMHARLSDANLFASAGHVPTILHERIHAPFSDHGTSRANHIYDGLLDGHRS